MAKYKVNSNVFNTIDSAEKAYWLGFIWCDGTVIKRVRGNSVTYELKIDLNKKDSEHLEELKKLLESTHELKYYTYKTSYGETDVARLYISNNILGGTLYNDYGIIANRTDITRMINKIPEEFICDFIRGVLDADGSLVLSNTELHKHNPLKKSAFAMKFAINFTTNSAICEFINNHLFEKGLLSQKLKLSKRHEGRDGDCVGLKISGNQQCEKILDYLYEKSSISLKRKQAKYIELKALNESKITELQRKTKP